MIIDMLKAIPQGGKRLKYPKRIFEVLNSIRVPRIHKKVFASILQNDNYNDADHNR